MTKRKFFETHVSIHINYDDKKWLKKKYGDKRTPYYERFELLRKDLDKTKNELQELKKQLQLPLNEN